ALKPFVQVDSSIARRYGGSGLGLSITKRFVELHGGRLEIDSRKGEGTRVTLHFPADRRLGRTRPAA
ncbi:MAG: ATP-binding protein, partial [Dongiaceae bacterium]